MKENKLTENFEKRIKNKHEERNEEIGGIFLKFSCCWLIQFLLFIKIV